MITDRDLSNYPWLCDAAAVDARLYWWAFVLTGDMFQNASNMLPLLDMLYELLQELRLIARSEYAHLLVWGGDPVRGLEDHPLFIVALQKVTSMTSLGGYITSPSEPTWEAAYKLCLGVVGEVAHSSSCDGNCVETTNGIACLALEPHRHYRAPVL